MNFILIIVFGVLVLFFFIRCVLVVVLKVFFLFTVLVAVLLLCLLVADVVLLMFLGVFVGSHDSIGKVIDLLFKVLVPVF